MTRRDRNADFARQNHFSFASSRLWQGTLIVLLVFLAYSPAFRGEFLWDDDANVTGNMPLRSLDGLRRIWFELGATQQYYPLTHTSFWVEYHLWGPNPLGYHMTNVSLHALNAILLLLVLRKLGVRGAWLGAALFALHPVHVESVAWITECKNTLSGFFYLGSIWACLKFWLPGKASSVAVAKPAQLSGAGYGPWKYYFSGLVLYLFALWSKTATVALPVVIFLLLWWKCGKVGWRNICLLLPFLAVGFVMGLVTMWVEKNHVGAGGQEWSFSFMERCLLTGRMLLFYAGKLLWPHPLMFVYPRWVIRVSQLTTYLPVLAAGTGLLILWLNRKGWGRPALCAAGCFIAMLFPVSGFFNVYFFRFSFVCDHFPYLASMGPLALAAAGVTLMLDFYQKRVSFLKPLVCGVLLAVLGGLTARQSQMYESDEALWRTTLEQNPGCWMAHNNLSALLLDKGEFTEAIAHCKKALEIKPDYADAHDSLGSALLKKGDVDAAIVEFDKALAINPRLEETHMKLIDALLRVGRADEAIRHGRIVLNNHLGNRMAQEDFAYIAWVLATSPDPSIRNGEKAIALAREAEQVSGGKSPLILGVLAAACAEGGRYSEAIATSYRAIQLAEAENNGALVSDLQTQLKCYEAGSPFRDFRTTR